MTPKLLTEKEVSELLRVSVPTLQTWRHRPPADPLPFTKIGGKVYYREDKINKWLDRHTFDDTEQSADHRKPA